MRHALTAFGIVLVLLGAGLALAAQLGRDERRTAVDNLPAATDAAVSKSRPRLE
jgi:hypothetical protein